MSAPGWVCATCGRAGAQALPGYTSFDPRYTTGYCDSCTDPHPDRPRKYPRPTSPLVIETAFDAVAFAQAREKAKLKTLVAALANGKATISLSDVQCHTLVTLFDKYGFPGVHIPPSVREASEKYAKSIAKPAGKKPAGRKRR